MFICALIKIVRVEQHSNCGTNLLLCQVLDSSKQPLLHPSRKIYLKKQHVKLNPTEQEEKATSERESRCKWRQTDQVSANKLSFEIKCFLVNFSSVAFHSRWIPEPGLCCFFRWQWYLSDISRMQRTWRRSQWTLCQRIWSLLRL